MSKEIKLKDSVIGGGSRVTVQSMLNVPAADVAGSVMQAVALERGGREILRPATPVKEAVGIFEAQTQA